MLDKIIFFDFKLGVPVRMTLDRDEDMISSGTRHPFFGKYKVSMCTMPLDIFFAGIPLKINSRYAKGLSF